MYKNKKEIDDHIRKSLSKIRSEKERNLRGLTIAKMYYKVSEFSIAEQYLSLYINENEANDQAHKLLGQCYQHLKKPDKALQSFQRSLQLNMKQSDVLVEVCKLLLEDTNCNTTKAAFWCEMAESERVQHDVVFSLRLKLLKSEHDTDDNHVEKMILKEIVAKPNDVSLRVRLVRVYIEQKKILEAFKYIYDVEMSFNDEFSNSAEWYNIQCLVLSQYEHMPNATKDWKYCLLLAICLERQIYMAFFHTENANSAGNTEIANLLFNFDQYLYKISTMSTNLKAQKELVNVFLNHYRGQLLLYAVSLLFKRELLQNKNKWKETVRMVLPLLLLGLQIELPDKKQPWTKHCDEHSSQLLQLWHREGAFRNAQLGRTLYSCITADEVLKKDAQNTSLWSDTHDLIAQIRQICTDKQWRRNVFALLFCNSDQRIKEQTSLLMTSAELAEPKYELPSYAEIETYEETAHYLNPKSLKHIVYLCIANDNLADVRAKFFSGLAFSTQNLSYCGPETLNQLDIDSYLYAATIQAKRVFELEQEGFENGNFSSRSTAGRPRILPFVNVQHKLCTEEQANWWNTAYLIYRNLCTENLAELRANLQFGIEAVRGVNGPKIDMFIIFKLGEIFIARAELITKTIEKAYLEARAEKLYKYGLNMLKLNEKGVLEPFRKYFKYTKPNTSEVERTINSIAENAVSYLAKRYFQKAEYEELIEELKGIQLPFATYLQAEAYRKLDEFSKTPKKQKRLYLERASDCLNQTATLLKTAQIDPNHPLNSVISNEIKRLQHVTSMFINDSVSFATNGHNNSSTYEDAEADLTNHSLINTANNRSRHESEVAAAAAAAAYISATQINDLEKTIKQMATTLISVKEVVDEFKTEMCSMRTDFTTMKDKIASLEEAMKNTHICSNPPSREDGSNVLDDLYMFEDALQTQFYPQQVPTQNGVFPLPANVPTPFAQPRLHTPTTMQIQNAAAAAAAAAFNSPMYNPNLPINYYSTPYMVTPQSANGTNGTVLNQRNVLEHTNNLYYNLPTNAPILTQTNQDNRNNNMYNLINQPMHGLPLLPVPISLPSIMSLPVTPSTATIHTIQAQQQTTHPTPTIQATEPMTVTTPAVQMNRILINQPVEKGPPANVVITSSDPLPNPNAPKQTQQPTLSVTIPSHHIKSNQVQTPDATSAVSTTTTQTHTLFQNKNTTNIIPPTTTVNLETFSFKPNIIKAAETLNKTAEKENLNDSFSSELNKSVNADAEVEYDPRPDFKAIIPLPAEVEVRTGEEDMTVVFCHRAKLFRHVDKEWKERGIGDIKILKHKDGTSHVIMRREQIHKLCANHTITKELIIKPINNESKGYVWYANDYSDGEIKPEKFFVRFKTANTAKEFYDAFKLAQQEDEEMRNDKEKMQPTQTFALTKSEVNNFGTTNLLAIAKTDLKTKFNETSATSTTDTVSISTANGKELPKVPTTTTAQQDATQQQNSMAPPAFALPKSGIGNFVTSTPANKGEPTKTKTDAVAATTAVNAATVTSSAAALKTLFGSNDNKQATNKPPTATTQAATSSPFANFSFGTATNSPATAAVGAANTTTSPFANLFGNLGKTTTQPISPFSTTTLLQTANNSTAGTNNTSSTANITTTAAPPATVAHQSDNEDEYVPTAQFNPVIPLPDLVEVTTGEENEIVLFEHRAKLLRFDKSTSEWKERGLGNIKLLQDKTDVNQVRIVMRREQVHKLCCNQRLYKNTKFNYSKNSKVALNWAGQDYSENELTAELFTIRFKTADICESFLNAVVAAQKQISSVSDEAADNKETFKSSDTTPTSATVAVEPKGFGDAFKPKVGSWSCEYCYINNTAETLYCVACESPKDSTVPKKESSNPLATNVPIGTFSFGFAPNNNSTKSFDSNNASNNSFFDNSEASTASVASNTSSVKADTAVGNVAADSTGFGDIFKPKAGSWTCQGCYLNNDSTAMYCNACEAPKDDTVPKKENNKNVLALSNPMQSFSFGFNAPTNANATTTLTSNKLDATTKPNKATVNTKTTVTPFNFGIAKPATNEFDAGAGGDALKPFTFPPPTATSTTINAPLGKQTFSFVLKSSSIENPKMPGEHSTNENKDTSNKLTFDFKTKEVTKPISNDKEKDKVNADEENDENIEEESTAYFAPVIPLPDKIDVKTGEENEDVLYMHRAKLYRFIDSEWKERGTGDVKILRHKDTKNLRVIMRRDRILKICLNHALNEEIEYKRKDDKSWMFAANDFSEGEYTLEKLALRFKTKDITDDFMNIVKSALAGTAEPIVVSEAKDDKAKADSQMNVSKDQTNDAAHKDTTKDKQTTTCINKNCGGCSICDSKLMTEPFVKETNSTKNYLTVKYPVSKLHRSYSKIALNTKNVKVPLESAKKKEKDTKNKPLLAKSNLTAIGAEKDKQTVTCDLNASGILTESKIKPTNAESKNASTFSFSAAFNDATKKDENKDQSSASLFGIKKDENKEQNNGSLFGNVSASNLATTGSLFGGNKTVFGQTPSIFGSNAANVNAPGADKTNNIFGGGASAKSIFSGHSTFSGTPTFGSGSIFDSGISQTESDKSSKNIFGGTSFGSNNVFGITDQAAGIDKSTKNIFGNTSGGNSLFGGANKTDEMSIKSIFGYAGPSETTYTDLLGAAALPTTGNDKSVKSIFGTTNTGNNIFGNVNAKSDIKPFGGTKIDSFNFGGLGQTANTNTKTDSSGGVGGSLFGGATALGTSNLSSKTGDIDFATLAANASNTNTFGTKTDKNNATGGFFGLTNQNAFASFKNGNVKSSNTSLNTSKSNDANANLIKNESEKDDNVNDENYDPHYEPIIALPEEITVSTGEENEEKLFGERATLYRWDATNSEWKERGVGEIKILKHRERNTYRLVMRREQIFKLVLNHAVGPDFMFQNMKNNVKSFLWGVVNYAESSEGALEKLAIRFPKEDIAKQFSAKLNECIKDAKDRAENN